LAAEDASNDLNDNWKNCFHVEIPPKEPEHNRPGRQRFGPSSAISQAKKALGGACRSAQSETRNYWFLVR
jgi:hypothetical protein